MTWNRRPSTLLALLLAAVAACIGAPPAATEAASASFVGFAPTSAAAEVDPGLAASLQQVLDSFVLERPAVGATAAAVLPDGSRWASGSGLADKDDPTSVMTGTTRSVAGSITKTFVGALILKLIEEGQLSLSTRLSRWFPEYSFARGVRIRHLLQHSSGIADYFKHPDYARLVYLRPRHHWTTSEILGLVQNKLLFAPGSGWSYSNTNYLFLGLIAERVTGHDLSTELGLRFFAPLDLADTYLQADAPSPPGAAHGYMKTKTGWAGLADGTDYRPNTSTATVAWAAGSMVSSAHDMASWTAALYGGHVVDSSSLALMTTFNSHRYGYSTMLIYVGGDAAWGHTGSLRGYVAATLFVPTIGITVSVLVNRGRIKPLALARELTLKIEEWLTAQPVAA